MKRSKANTWHNWLVVKIPTELGLGLSVHDALEENFDSFLHSVPFYFRDESRRTAIFRFDRQRSCRWTLRYPVCSGITGVHLLLDIVITHSSVVIHTEPSWVFSSPV